MTGSGSLIAAASKPFVSYGFEGTTIFNPAIWENNDSPDSQCSSKALIPVPYGALTTNGHVNLPLLLILILAAWLNNWSNPAYINPENWISATGFIPLTASPIEAPTIPSSERGVSITLSAPNSFCNPSVARKTPPFNPTSSPSTTTLLSSFNSCLNPIVTACTTFATVIFVNLFYFSLNPTRYARQYLVLGFRCLICE